MTNDDEQPVWQRLVDRAILRQRVAAGQPASRPFSTMSAWYVARRRSPTHAGCPSDQSVGRPDSAVAMLWGGCQGG